MSKKRIVTHSAGFHADDVFAVATLFLYLGNQETEVVRSRDEEVVKSADFVVDVGNVYDPEKNRFDHHQRGGAGIRGNGVPYASFGLVWKEFGRKISDSHQVSESIDKRIVQFIDAVDNGFETFKPVFPEVLPYDIAQVIASFEPTWKELKDTENNERFLEAVLLAKDILNREIKNTKDWLEGEKIIIDSYEKSMNKNLIILENEDISDRVLITYTLLKFKEPLYAVFRGKGSDGTNDPQWRVVAINKSKSTFNLRKPLPQSWRGKRDEDLISVTGVADAIFCHKAGFTCGSKTKESAIKLAKMALEA